MIIQYNIVVTIINLLDNSTSKFSKIFDVNITATDALLYNNYHILSKGVYILDMFKDEVDAYCTALGIESSSVEIDEFEIVSLTDRADVYFEAEEDNTLSLKPTIKCYVYPKNDALKTPNLVGVAYDSTTIIWSWPDDEEYAHYLIEEAIDPNSEADKGKIIAQLPIGVTSYTETGLKPDTAYTRRLINYTDEQTSAVSPSATVMTEPVKVEQSLEEYAIPKNYDFTTDESEKEIIEENLQSFHSGIGDGNDLKVYKQMDTDFRQKFKPYFEVSGKRIETEKRYEQVGFNYKLCMEAIETVEEQEGEVTFDIDVYPREEITVEQYMHGTMPVNVFAKLYATVFLRKEAGKEEDLEITTMEEVWEDTDDIINFYGDPLNIVFVLDKTNSLKRVEGGQGPAIMKNAVKNCINKIEANKGSATIKYCVIEFSTKSFTKQRTNGFVSAAEAKKAVDNMPIDGSGTSWGAGLKCAKDAIKNSGLDGKFVTYFFSDGFSNTPTDTDASSMWKANAHEKIGNAMYVVDEKGLLKDIQNQAASLKAVCEKVACMIPSVSSDGSYRDYIDWSTMNGKGSGYTAEYIKACHLAVAYNEKSALKWSSGSQMTKIFTDYIKEYTEVIPGKPEYKGYQPKKQTIKVPYNIDEVKAVMVETDLIGPFVFDEDLTPVYYSQKEKRVVLDKLHFLAPHSTKMSETSVYDLILEAAKKTPEWGAGYNKTIGTTDGSYLIKGLFIKDTYGYGDEDIIDDATFDSADLEYGTVGSVNVTTDISKADNSTYGDDCYLISKNNYVYIDGYTDAIIYEGNRFLTTELNAYNHSSEIILSTLEDFSKCLFNRKNKDIGYTGGLENITSTLVVYEKGKDIWIEGCEGLVEEGSVAVIKGITQDIIAHNDMVHESPVLNYRFNLEDPDSKTCFYEILPDSDPNSNYKNIVLLHIYYARNVYITDEDHYVESFGTTPNANSSSPYMPLVEGQNQWTLMEWKDNKDDCRYIDEYIWFMAKPMTIQRDYYDELPGNGMEDFYGLVNGRYSASNPDGRKDLRVDTPQFNIPTTVDRNTMKIYILMTEFYPDTALVSYKWDNPSSEENSVTQVNGDYVTFSSDNLTYKDIPYIDTIATINTGTQEIVDNEAVEILFEFTKPESEKEYVNYYLNVVTDNADVLALRYPTEIAFDDTNMTSIGVTFKGVVNATSQWAPRIHNGYYYLNQHEYYAFSEFDVEANFDTYEEYEYNKVDTYVTFDVTLRRPAAPTENYAIVKNARAELLQDETKFQWVNGRGITLKPHIEGEYYQEYLSYEYISPIVLFENALTAAGPLSVEYDFEDGSIELPLEIRSYDIANGIWSPWQSFVNNTIPAVPLSSAYQVRMTLQASTQHTDLEVEDYMCCYLDWKDDIDEDNTTNIVTVTDYMTTGPDAGDGIYVSKVFDFGCITKMSMDIFQSQYEKDVQIYIGCSNNNPNNLLLENIQWTNISSLPDQEFTGRYFRYKIMVPEGEKLYWLHKKIKTLQTHALLPYVSQISMTGSYTPTDTTMNFVNTEVFELTKDGEYHTAFNRVLNIIGADVLERGFTESEIESVNIQCVTENVEMLYSSDNILETSIELKSDVDMKVMLKHTPYILVEKDESDEFDIIKITGTPQQFSPITVEDEEGNGYIQLYGANSFIQEENYLLTEATKYIELKSNRYDTRFKVFVDEEELDVDNYRVVNHLLIFNDEIGVGHTVRIEYCILRSFIADIDRDNNTTIIYLHPGEGIPVPEKCKVFFETNTKNNKFIASDLSLNPIYRTDYKGFIYLTDEHNDAYELKIHCNPLRIKSGGYDKVDILVEVLDINGNPVVAKDVAVDCNYGILNCESYETDMNGVIHLVYESAYFSCADTLSARVITDNDTVIEQSITIINE